MTSDPDDAQPGPDPAGAVPPEVVARATAAFERLVAAPDLAPLVYDSLAEGATSPRRFWLVFQHEDAQLQCAVTPGATGWDLRARIDPPQACGAELEVDGSEVALVGASGVGEFTFGSVPAGVMRITVTARGGGPLLRTDWFLIGAPPDR